MAEASRASPLAGKTLAGKYRILRLLGEGGMGLVYEAMHQRLGERVAIKMLREQERQNPELVARFEREARMAAKLKSVNVARIFDVDSLEDGTPFIVMELLEGRDLDAEIAERGPLPVEEGIGYVLEACSAVQEAHARGIIHRDLKPHNLFLCGEGLDRRVKLLDFGISKLQEGDSSVTATRSALGTPLYMSPEQIRSARKADARSDIWSLGVILYEVLTGSTPFSGESPTAVVAAITADPVRDPRELRSDLPEAVYRVMLRALEKDPERRFQTVEELARALAPYGVSGTWAPEHAVPSNPAHPDASPRMTHAPTIRATAPSASDPSAPDSAQPAATLLVEPARPRRLALGFALSALLLALVVGLLSYWLGQSVPSPEPIATGTLLAPSTPMPAPTATVTPVVELTASVEPAPSASAPKALPRKPAAGQPATARTPSEATTKKPPSSPKPEPKDPGIPLTL